jgi:hypothetical protein
MLRGRRWVLGRYLTQLPPLRRSWVFIIFSVAVMTVVAALGMVDATADLFSLILVLPLLFKLLRRLNLVVVVSLILLLMSSLLHHIHSNLSVLFTLLRRLLTLVLIMKRKAVS